MSSRTRLAFPAHQLKGAFPMERTFFMIHISPKVLGATSPATAFLSLLWSEYFDKYTIDSYQPKLCDIPCLVDEILEVCQQSVVHEGWGGHLAFLQAELKSMLDSASQRGEISSFDSWRLAELHSAQTCPAALQTARILIGDGFRERFEDQIFMNARLIPGLLPKGKATAERDLGQLATLAIQRGYEPGNRKEILESTLSKSPETWIDGLLSRLQSRPQEFFVLFAIAPANGDISAKLHRVVTAAGYVIENPENFKELDPPADHLLVSKAPQSATSPAAALQGAIRGIEPVLDMLSFYLVTRAVALPDQGWVGKTKDNLVATQLPSQSLRLVQPHSNADSLVMHALTSANSSPKPFDGSVSNALELHSTAMRAIDVRTRFLNLWAALECLSSLVPYKTIIERVYRLVGPIVTWRKVDKISRYIAINLHLWRKQSKQSTNKSTALPGAGSGSVPTSEVMMALCKPANHPDILELLAMSSGHPLLCHRINCVWKTFHDPDALGNSLTASKERLHWHIRRIYRARNLLVHQGIESPRLGSLCDNLHYYVSAVLSRVIHGISMHRGWSSADSAQHWCMTGNFFLEKIKSEPRILSLENIEPKTHENKSILKPWDIAPPQPPS